MQLSVDQRIEQGTKQGVMKFRPGQVYSVEPQGEEFLVTHEPAIRTQRVQEGDKTVRKPVVVTQTLVSAGVFDKLKLYAKVEG